MSVLITKQLSRCSSTDPSLTAMTIRALHHIPCASRWRPAPLLVALAHQEYNISCPVPGRCDEQASSPYPCPCPGPGAHDESTNSHVLFAFVFPGHGHHWPAEEELMPTKIAARTLWLLPFVIGDVRVAGIGPPFRRRRHALAFRQPAC